MSRQGLEVRPVAGLPEVRAGDDFVALLAGVELCEGDVLAVSSKVVAKAEGRLRPGMSREEAVAAETVRVVASRGPLRIVETRHGLVMAAGGVDASNTGGEEGVLLLPEDPDASARRLRAGLMAARGLHRLGVVVTDTAGRTWRQGQADLAVGVAGLRPLLDLRGGVDADGRLLEVTVTAVADEVAAAADLVKAKAARVPVALVRGLSDHVLDEDGEGAAALVRPPVDDLFRLGTREAVAEGARGAVAARRTVRSFRSDTPDPSAVERALAAAVTAPAPHHTVPWRFAVVETPAVRAAYLDAMKAAWEEDLRADGFSEEQVTRRVRRGDVLRGAPLLVVPCLVAEGAHAYPDSRRQTAEREMFLLAAGAGVEALLVALAAEGLASAWVSSSLFCRPVARGALDLPPEWEPCGTVAVGYAADHPQPRPMRDLDRLVVRR